MNDQLCRGCDLPLALNDLGLCKACSAKLERDLIRLWEWEKSVSARNVPREQLEALRTRVIGEFGTAYELLEEPHDYRAKNKRSHSTNTERKRAIAAAAIRDYTTDDVLQAAHDFIYAQSDEWVNFSRVASYLYERFYHLKPKRLGQPGTRHNSLLKLIADFPERFELRSEPDGRGVWWIRLAS